MPRRKRNAKPFAGLFAGWPTARLQALHRVAKTRGIAFFRDPYLMIALRDELEGRTDG